MSKQIEQPFSKNPYERFEIDYQKALKTAGIVGKTINITPTIPEKIFDVKNEKNIGILRLDQATIADFTKKSGPLANNNEYQIHYWALVLRLKYTDESIIDIAFPTVIYNYEQEVSGAHVDFELRDVEAMSNAVLPLHDVLANNILAQLETELQKMQNLPSYEFLSVPLNTLHRHPTGVANFSGTDLRKNHITETGVVFPLASGDNTPSFSSIIYNHPARLIRTEYRLATGNTNEAGITYRKGRCIALSKKIPEVRSMAENWFMSTENTDEYAIISNGITPNIPQSLLDLINSVTVEPNTQFVNPDNVKQRTYSFERTYPTVVTNGKPKQKEKAINQGNFLIADAATVEEVEKAHHLVFYSKEILAALPFSKLLDAYLAAELIYYGKNEAEAPLENERTDIEQTLDELQFLIYEEYVESLEDAIAAAEGKEADEVHDIYVDYCYEKLILAGFSAAVLENMVDDKIIKTYEDLMGE